MDSVEPIMRIGPYYFKGRVVSTVGTSLVVDSQSSEHHGRTVIGPLKALVTKKVIFQRVYLKSK